MRKSWITSLFLVLILVLAACGGGGDEPTASSSSAVSNENSSSTTNEGGGTQTVVIGYTASQTGSQNVSSTRQVNGFQLWMDALNEAGGLELSDGTKITFEGVTYDDESNTDRVQELYTRLATEDEADFLISPYSSGLTAAAAVIAEQYGKVMVTTGAASDDTYKQGLTTVYQAYTPASRYLTGALDLLQQTDPDVNKLAFIYENSKFSTDVVEAAKSYAESLGYEIVLFEGYDPETNDFGPFINKIQDSEPDAILGGGHFQDGSTFARQLDEKNIGVNFFTLLVAPPEPDFADLGQAAVGVTGPSQWEPQAAFTAESATEAGLEWYGLSSDEFVAAYEAAYDGEEPSYHSAGGYAAGLILEKAILDADSTEPEKIQAALDAMDLLTFFGHIHFDTSADAHGLQIGHSMVYIQWQDNNGLLKEVVWPMEGATADLLYPMP